MNTKQIINELKNEKTSSSLQPFIRQFNYLDNGRAAQASVEAIFK